MMRLERTMEDSAGQGLRLSPIDGEESLRSSKQVDDLDWVEF